MSPDGKYEVIRTAASNKKRGLIVAALLRVRPQFHLVFTDMLRMLRVQGRDGALPPPS